MKHSRTILKLFTLTVSLCLLLSACANPKEQLIGTWKAENGSELVLYEDGTCTLAGDQATWTITDDRIKFADPQGSHADQTAAYQLNGDTLKVLFGSNTIIFSRVS